MPRRAKNSNPGNPTAGIGRLEQPANLDGTKINWRFTRKKARRKFGYTRPERNIYKRSKT
jgi:hypothetical protein